MLAITNTIIVKKDHLVIDGLILIEGNQIVYSDKAKEIPAESQIFDAQGLYSGPGLIDIHTHAGEGNWFYEEPELAARAHLKHGTTSVYPAIYFNMSNEEYIKAIRTLKKASKAEKGSNIKGIYMEGPYLNPKFGCDKENNKWKERIEKSQYKAILEEAKDFATFWSVAPEREGIIEFIKDVKSEIPNVIFTVAHSEASPYQIEELIPYGLKIGTHHTNATGNRPMYPECRGVCVDEAVNANEEIYAELIVDSKGIHVDPYMLRLVVKIKGKDKIVLISDACVFDGPVPEGYDGVTDINFDFNGDIAGSKLTLDVACRNMMIHTGASICDAFRFASLNPAKLLKRDDMGRISEGAIADIVITDHFMNIQRVIKEGQFVKF